MKSQFAALVCAGALSGCGSVYQSRAQEFIATQPESAWGSAPWTGHREFEKVAVLGQLKDPDSAKFSFRDPYRAVISRGFGDTTVVPVWVSEVSVNAKNGFGGYTGFKLWSFLYRHGKLVSTIDSVGYQKYLPENSPEWTAPMTPAATPETSTSAPKVSPTPPASPTTETRDAYAAERLAKEKQCNQVPAGKLSAKGPGFETYNVACTNGDTMTIRCEYGNCRALQ